MDIYGSITGECHKRSAWDGWREEIKKGVDVLSYLAMEGRRVPLSAIGMLLLSLSPRPECCPTCLPSRFTASPCRQPPNQPIQEEWVTGSRLAGVIRIENKRTRTGQMRVETRDENAWKEGRRFFRRRGMREAAKRHWSPPREGDVLRRVTRQHRAAFGAGVSLL
jgi:hypothetical protein